LAETPHQSPKILRKDKLQARIAQVRAEGRTVVQCHGCFDLVHPGHVRHLQYAARLGDHLLVSLTGDDAMNKGIGRPLIPQELRAENLAALDCVDWVHIDPNATAVELLADIKPDVYVKGREYEANRDPRFIAEREVVEMSGGRVVYSSGDIVFSSTALIANMNDEIGAEDPASVRLHQLASRDDLQPSRLDRVLAGCEGRHILIIGELILDTYVHCDRPEVASEAAMMSLRPIQRTYYDGGAAVVAKHLRALGARPVLITAASMRDEHLAMIERLRARDIRVHAIANDTPLLEKQRYIVGREKVVRIDHTQPIMLDGRARDELLACAREVAGSVDGALLCDYGSGLLTPSLIENLCDELRPRVGVLAADVSGHRANLLSMRDMDFVCPNENELRETMRDFGESLSAVVWRYLEQRNIREAIITLGDEGAVAFSRKPESRRERAWASRLSGDHIPALTRHVVDELGCGDAVLAIAMLARTAGASLAQAAYLGSLAAASQAERRGNCVVSTADIARMMRRVASSYLAAVRVS
jgi:rfaE bifunctional protein kinase chain/domain/rfaE bifunctional protein nucleotidyltransferase chain/domain